MDTDTNTGTCGKTAFDRTPDFEACLVNHKEYEALPEGMKSELFKHKEITLFRYENVGKIGWAKASHAASTGRFNGNTVYRIDATAVNDMSNKEKLLESVTHADFKALWNSSRVPFNDLSDRTQSMLCLLGGKLQVWTGGKDWNSLALPKETRGDFVSNYAYRVAPKALMELFTNSKAIPEKDKGTPKAAAAAAYAGTTANVTASNSVTTYTVDRPLYCVAGGRVPASYGVNPMTMFAVLRVTDLSPTPEDPRLGNMTFMCSRATLEEAEKAVIFYGSYGIPMTPGSTGSRFAICEMVKLVAPVLEVKPEGNPEVKPEEGGT